MTSVDFVKRFVSRVPKDLIYVDQPRLDHYAEQMASSVKQRRPFAWTLKLGLSPSLEIKSEQGVEPLSNSKKIRVLLEGLAAESVLHLGRVSTYRARLERDDVFRVEDATVFHAFVPPLTAEALAVARYGRVAQERPEDDVERAPMRPGGDLLEERARWGRVAARERMIELARREIADFKGLHLWLSHPWYDPRREPTGHPEPQLLLVADLKRGDLEIAPGGSAFSALVGLFDEVGDVNLSVLAPVTEQARNPASGFHRRFLADPREALESVGVRCGEPRPVETLYHVRRVVGYRTPGGHEAVTTVAYPIYIAAVGA